MYEVFNISARPTWSFTMSLIVSMLKSVNIYVKRMYSFKSVFDQIVLIYQINKFIYF